VVTGVAEIAVGFVFAWLAGKARQVAGRADAEIDRGLAVGMDALHALVSDALRQDPAWEQARQEAEAGREELTERTRRRLTDSLQDAAERDAAFAKALEWLVSELRAAAVAAGGGVSASASGVAVGGSAKIHAEGGSAAALTMGSVTIGAAVNPPTPDTGQG
jgi:hypothetical protein